MSWLDARNDGNTDSYGRWEIVPMIEDEEVSAICVAAAEGLVEYGTSSGHRDDAEIVANELIRAASDDVSISRQAHAICRTALTMYSRFSGMGQLLYVVNARLMRIKVRGYSDRACIKTIIDSCGVLRPFVLLVLEGLRCEFPHRAGPMVLFRGIEISPATLEEFRHNIGRIFIWSMFAWFTDDRQKAEEGARPWRGGIPAIIQMETAGCARMENGSYLLSPFSFLYVEAVVGDTVRVTHFDTARLRYFAKRSKNPILTPGTFTGLHKAARQGDVRAILREAIDVRSVTGRNAEDCTPLGVAVISSRTDAVNALLWLGADPNCRQWKGATPLFYAAQNGSVSIVELLCAFGADISATNEQGDTALFSAARNGHDGVVRLLVSLGADINAIGPGGMTPVCIASFRGHDSTVRALATLNADLNRRPERGVTPLYAAARRGHETTVRLLVSMGADVNTGTNEGMIPLFAAAKEGNEDMVCLLCSLGANVNARNQDGQTPAYLEALEGRLSMVRVLASLGADMDIASHEGFTPLHAASVKGHAAVVFELLSLGVNVNKQSACGWTPLFAAESQDHKDVIAILLRAGGLHNVATARRDTPLSVM
jgi:ankyrin repeat protein